MKLLERILLAIDFDDAVDPLMNAVAKLATPFGAEVILFHAIEPGTIDPHRTQELEKPIRDRLQQLAARLRHAGIAVGDVVCQTGKAARSTLTAAERYDVNLVMLSASSSSADHTDSIGTTAERVMRGALRPVLTVQPDRPLDLMNILCPVDFSLASARGLTNAIRLARVFHSRLHILHVIKPPSRYERLDQAWAQWAIKAEVQASDQAVREMNELLDQFDLSSLNWEKRIERGDPARTIVEMAQSVQAGLITMGSTGRTGMPYWLLGSTAVKVARHLPCSLLTVKQEQVLSAHLEQNIADIRELFSEGRELLEAGFHQEALARFDRCLELDPHFTHAIEAKAEVHERLGQSDRAVEYRRTAEMVRRGLWDQQVQASIRASHPLFSRHSE